MTAASDARIAANRLNAQKSTGPRTPEGKSRSRENATKHGLAGDGVVVPPELREEVEAQAEALRAELRPRTALGAFLVHQAALASVRCRRAARQESAALACRVRNAEADWDDARAAEVDHAFEQLPDDPATQRRRLLRTPEGTTRLLEALTDLRRGLVATTPIWDSAQGILLEALLGRRADALLPSATAVLSRAALGDARWVEASSIAHLPDVAAVRAWARHQLAEAICAEAGRLAEHFETIDFEAIEADRAGAADRALFDPGAEATLARRYEAASSRLFFRALRELREAEADALERSATLGPAPPAAKPPQPTIRPLPPSSPTPAERPRAEFVDRAIGRPTADDPGAAPESGPLGSFGAGPALVRAGATPAPAPALGSPTEPDARVNLAPPVGSLDPDRLRMVVNLLV